MPNDWQPDLLMKDNPRYWRFMYWVNSAPGAAAAREFLHVALQQHSRGVRMSAKAIWERLRGDFMLRNAESRPRWAWDNNHAAYMARWAMEAEPVRLKGYFRVRAVRVARERRPRAFIGTASSSPAPVDVATGSPAELTQAIAGGVADPAPGSGSPLGLGMMVHDGWQQPEPNGEIKHE